MASWPLNWVLAIWLWVGANWKLIPWNGLKFREFVPAVFAAERPKIEDPVLTLVERERWLWDDVDCREDSLSSAEKLMF